MTARIRALGGWARRGGRPRRLSLGALLTAATIALSGCGISLQSLPQIGGSSGGYTIHAVFDNVSALAANAEVREGDAVVGRVTAIKARNYQAVINMQIKSGVQLPVDTTAEARFSTPLGDEYIALTVPPSNDTGSTHLLPGATLPDAQTHAAPTVADTFAALAAVLYGGGLGQAETVVTELNSLLGGRGPEIGTLLSEVNTTVSSLAANDTSIDNALTAVSKVSGQLNAGSSSIVAALNTLPAAAQTLEANNTALNQLLAGIDKLSPAVVNIVNTSGANLISDSQQLAPVSLQLAKIQGQIGQDLTDLHRFAVDLSHFSPAGYAQVLVDFTGLFPANLCIPHLVPGTNPTPCSPTGGNFVPPQGLSTQSTSASSTGSSSSALDTLRSSIP